MKFCGPCSKKNKQKINGVQECDHIDVAETGEPLAVPPISPSDPFEFVGDGHNTPLGEDGGRTPDGCNDDLGMLAPRSPGPLTPCGFLDDGPATPVREAAMRESLDDWIDEYSPASPLPDLVLGEDDVHRPSALALVESVALRAPEEHGVAELPSELPAEDGVWRDEVLVQMASEGIVDNVGAVGADADASEEPKGASEALVAEGPKSVGASRITSWNPLPGIWKIESAFKHLSDLQIRVRLKYGFEHIKSTVTPNTILSIRRRGVEDLFRSLGDALRPQAVLSVALIDELKGGADELSEQMCSDLAAADMSASTFEPDIDLLMQGGTVATKAAAQKQDIFMDFYKVVMKGANQIVGQRRDVGTAWKKGELVVAQQTFCLKDTVRYQDVFLYTDPS